jgi:hypothetical protein
VTATGWTFQQVRESAWLDVWNLWLYWADHPPMHILTAAGVGAGFPMKKKAKPSTTPTVATGPARPFTTLPRAVQSAIQAERKKGLAKKQ